LEACKYLCNVVFYYCGKRKLQEKVGTTLQFDAFELFFMHFQEWWVRNGLLPPNLFWVIRSHKMVDETSTMTGEMCILSLMRNKNIMAIN
jgi:hypothetical protein